jgi:uridylate kinase
MKTLVISLGGSLIIPEKIDFTFLKKFKSTLRKKYTKYKFVIVCGGGVIARKYISVLKKAGQSNYKLNQAGIRATRLNAQFMMQIFGDEANSTLPRNMKEVKANIPKNHVVFCGALRYQPDSTSDETAAKLAKYLNTSFINLTNVKGLFTDNPKTNKNAKFIPKISWKDFEKKALKLKHKPGQHFVLDQKAASLIRKHNIPTYIIGPNLTNLSKILNNKPFTGTIIQG